MTETYSKSRQQAETAFGNLQAPFFAKDKAKEELDAVAQSRDAKTLRLREARLAKEFADHASAMLASAKRVKRS